MQPLPHNPIKINPSSAPETLASLQQVNLKQNLATQVLNQKADASQKKLTAHSVVNLSNPISSQAPTHATATKVNQVTHAQSSDKTGKSTSPIRPTPKQKAPKNTVLTFLDLKSYCNLLAACDKTQKLVPFLLLDTFSSIEMICQKIEVLKNKLEGFFLKTEDESAILSLDSLFICYIVQYLQSPAGANVTATEIHECLKKAKEMGLQFSTERSSYYLEKGSKRKPQNTLYITPPYLTSSLSFLDSAQMLAPESPLALFSQELYSLFQFELERKTKGEDLPGYLKQHWRLNLQKQELAKDTIHSACLTWIITVYEEESVSTFELYCESYLQTAESEALLYLLQDYDGFELLLNLEKNAFRCLLAMLAIFDQPATQFDFEIKEIIGKTLSRPNLKSANLRGNKLRYHLLQQIFSGKGKTREDALAFFATEGLSPLLFASIAHSSFASLEKQSQLFFDSISLSIQDLDEKGFKWTNALAKFRNYWPRALAPLSKSKALAILQKIKKQIAHKDLLNLVESIAKFTLPPHQVEKILSAVSPSSFSQSMSQSISQSKDQGLEDSFAALSLKGNSPHPIKEAADLKSLPDLSMERIETTFAYLAENGGLYFKEKALLLFQSLAILIAQIDQERQETQMIAAFTSILNEDRQEAKRNTPFAKLYNQLQALIDEVNIYHAQRLLSLFFSFKMPQKLKLKLEEKALQQSDISTIASLVRNFVCLTPKPNSSFIKQLNEALAIQGTKLLYPLVAELFNPISPIKKIAPFLSFFECIAIAELRSQALVHFIKIRSEQFNDSVNDKSESFKLEKKALAELDKIADHSQWQQALKLLRHHFIVLGKNKILNNYKGNETEFKNQLQIKIDSSAQSLNLLRNRDTDLVMAKILTFFEGNEKEQIEEMLANYKENQTFAKIKRSLKEDEHLLDKAYRLVAYNLGKEEFLSLHENDKKPLFSDDINQKLKYLIVNYIVKTLIKEKDFKLACVVIANLKSEKAKQPFFEMVQQAAPYPLPFYLPAKSGAEIIEKFLS